MYQQANDASRMREFFDSLARDIERVPCGQGITGMSTSEIEAVRSLYAGQHFPAYYHEFLCRMGVSAGVLWLGTDAFYPRLLEVRSWAIDLLAENSASHLMPKDAIVIAVHQGYQAYWLEPSALNDPPAVTYIEGSRDISRRWGSLSDLLRSEAAVEIANWERAHG